MASVYLMFIFGSITMLFTVALFQVGGHVEAYGCRVVYEKNLTTFDKVVDIFIKNNSKISENLKSLKIGEIVSKCEHNAAAYEVIPTLEEMLNVNFTFDAEIDNLNLGEYAPRMNQVIEEVIKQFKENIATLGELTNINDLQDLLGLAKSNLINANIDQTIDDLENIVDPSDKVKEVLKILQDLQKASRIRNDIVTILGKNSEEIDRIAKIVEKTKQNIESSFYKIAPKLAKVTEEKVAEYFNDILQQVKDFAKEATNSVKTEVGKCGPLYNAFSIGRHFACREILGPLNALWFSLGMCCFLFLFAIPFATKLSKHFYIMNEEVDSYIGMDSLHGHQAQPVYAYIDNQEPLHKDANNFSNGMQPRPTHHQNGAYEPDIEDRWTKY